MAKGINKQAALEHVDSVITKLERLMKTAGIPVTAEELAELALRKLAQEDEAGESAEHEAAEELAAKALATEGEEKSKEEGKNGEEGKEEAKKEEEEKKEAQAKIASAYQKLQTLDKTASAPQAPTPTAPAAAMTEQQKVAAFENSVVQRAREIMVYSGIDPETGGTLSKIALARTPEELRDAAAMELLEVKGYPMYWDPSYLGRALGR